MKDEASTGGRTLGQKVHPISFRLGIIKSWDSRWYAEKDYSQLLIEDIRIRDYLKKKLHHAGVSKIEIERAASKAKKARRKASLALSSGTPSIS